MTGNNLSDKEIRDLLRRRLLEQEEDDDPLTQKLTDMEAKLVFGSEAQYVPSPQKEKELFDSDKNRYSFLKWLLPAIAVAVSILLAYYSNHEKQYVVEVSAEIPPVDDLLNRLPGQKTDAVVLTDSAFSETRAVQIPQTATDTMPADTIKKEDVERYTTGDPGIKVDYKPRKHNPKFVDAYENVPVLSAHEMAVTKKFKERMVKQLIKKDKNTWSYIPMSTGVFYGETVSMNAFYISTSEVTNNQYRTFLNDLIIQGKIEEYMKAVPDTSRWISDGRALFYKLQPDSTKWPGTAGERFEPMRKNYFWHPAYDSYPVVNVSREAAKMYCDWLTNAVNEKIKKDNPESKWESLLMNDLRIPHDTEWMMAAKGGNQDAEYPWSKKFTSSKSPQNAHGCYLANFCIRNYKSEKDCPNKNFPDAYTSAGSVSLDYTYVAPVMSYNPNDYNLYCVSGNVAEMVHVSKTGKPGTKGGSWGSDAEHIKIEAEDEYSNITAGSMFIGFRPVFTAKVKK
jgi:formylglycine-generating enzyme required for sulfatase activity